MKTKIITTIGPASSDYATLERFILEGVNIFRINFSHGTHREHQETIGRIHELNRKYETHAGILADLQGPKIRVGDLRGSFIALKKDEEVTLVCNKIQQQGDEIPVDYKDFALDVNVGECIQIDDGRLLLEVIRKESDFSVKAKVLYGGKLYSRKGINLPNTHINLPALTEKDFTDLDFILGQKVQWVALSFVRYASDIIELRRYIGKKLKRKAPLLVAKIEKPEALIDLEKIIEMADALMIARGDLGIEVPLEEVPLIQKKIIRECMKKAKPSIIATQMMEGMIKNFSPTRAEVNDVANSVIDGADALMLSGETSMGHNPVRVVQVMKKIITHVEKSEDIYYKHLPAGGNKMNRRFISDSVIYNACEMARQIDAKAIAGITNSGYSAFQIAARRPKAQVYVFTGNRSILSKLSLVWGISGIYYNKFISTDHTITDILLQLKNKGITQSGDLVINLTTTPLEKQGKTNMVKLSIV
ncbi:MAG: pyruvate kinase [Bacteroidales bacterium]